jgi:hypothetical protein
MNSLTKSGLLRENLEQVKSYTKNKGVDAAPVSYKDADCQSTEDFDLAGKYPSTLSPLITINDSEEVEESPINHMPDRTPNSDTYQ